MTSKEQPIPLPALALGLGGLLPFLISAFVACLPHVTLQAAGFGADVSNERQIQQFALSALGAYGAVILSFLGGIRWGNLVNDSARVRMWGPLVLSVVPSLVAWPALLLPVNWMLSILVVGFVVQYIADVDAVEKQTLPGWFGRLRTILTTGACVSLIAGALANAYLIE